MPIYQYECNDCLCRFELKQSFNEDTQVSCPQCGSGTRRLISPVAVIFKGPGFYCTDSRQNHGDPTSDGGEDKTTGGKLESKGDKDKTTGGKLESKGDKDKTTSGKLESKRDRDKTGGDTYGHRKSDDG